MASTIGTVIQDLIDFTAKVEKLKKQWDEIKDLVDQLFHGGQETGQDDRNRVVKLSDVIEVMEKFRVGNLKDEVVGIYQRIQAEIFEVLHPPSEQVSDLVGQQDPEAKLGRVATKIIGYAQIVLNFTDRVSAILDEAKKLIMLLDFVTNQENEIRDLALSQANKQTKVDSVTRKRQAT